jgi:hypothetical protein
MAEILKTEERTFNLVVDSVPYIIKATPFYFNDELRYEVKINDDTEHVFAWDVELTGFRAIDDDASVLSDVVEEAISQKLREEQQ